MISTDARTMTLFAPQNIMSDIENMMNAVDRIKQSVSKYTVVVASIIFLLSSR